MDSFAEANLKRKIDSAMTSVRRLLDTTRHPQIASDVPHSYTDKYLLTEFLSNATLASQLNALAYLGLNSEKLATLVKWSESRTVSLRFIANEKCDFDREVKREQDSDTKVVTEGRFLGSALSSTTKVVTTITEYFWNFTFEYQIVAFRGVGAAEGDTLVLSGRSGAHEIKTSSDRSPRPKVKAPAQVAEVDITWLLQTLALLEDGTAPVPAFKIDRSATTCHTPRRNPEVEANLKSSGALAAFTRTVFLYFENNIFNMITPRLHASITSAEDVFVPVLPLMEDPDLASDDQEELEAEEKQAEDAAQTQAQSQALVVSLGGSTANTSEPSALLPIADLNLFIGEEARTLSQRIQESAAAVIQAYTPEGGLASPLETKIIIACKHLQSAHQALVSTMGFIEHMMYTQLVAAIGKEVTPKEFGEYMRFHNRKLFAPAYAPGPFCFAVRRSNDHSPEGTISIEYKDESADIPEAITTIVRHSTDSHRMKFALNAAAEVAFDGDRYLHAYLQHQFSGATGPQLSLVAKARQFSSMIVMIGRITAADTFDPKHAIIVQNKDELTIPLELSTIPTPKEFRDAIESLSPEQQRFAKAFRSMQLESTLFGMLVIQIKPQLEKVLKLDPDSLTKELRLTQDLMDLFIEYQIPSDLLSFDGDVDAQSARDKITAVKQHVAAMHQMIHGSKKEELKDRKMEAKYSMRRGDAGYNYAMDDALNESENFRAARGGGMMKSKKKNAPQARRSSRQDRSARSAPVADFLSVEPPVQIESKIGLPPPMPEAQSQPESQVGQEQQQQSQDQPPQQHATEEGDESSGGQIVDYTAIPKQLDARFEALDTDSALRPTIITAGDAWKQKCKRTLLGSETINMLASDGQKKERDAAFDLLDALTRGGALSVDHATLHIVIAATHCFEKSVMNTVVQDNVSPIEKVERSELIIATTIHNQGPEALLKTSQVGRIKDTAPMLFPAIEEE